MKKVYSLIAAVLAICTFAHAQSQLGEIRGKVIDSKTKKPLDYASITIELNGVVKATTLSEDDGSYIVKTLQPGNYTVKVTYSGYSNIVVKDVEVISDQIAFVNVPMELAGVEIKEVVIVNKKPLIDPSGTSGNTKTSTEIMRLGVRNVNAIAATTAGVDARAGSTPNFRGARADGTAYYIDGVRVQSGSLNIPQNAIDQIQVITGGTPAQYGDFTGGAIAINTKSPSKNWQGGFEYTTASPFNGTIDYSQYNELQAFVSGPLKIINKDKGDKERVLFGFSLAGSGTYTRDSRLPVTDIYKVKDEKQREIERAPLIAQEAGGFIPAGEYLTKDDLEKVNFRQNAANYQVNVSGNFTYQPVNNISVKLGYFGSYFRGRAFSYAHSLMNSDNNAIQQDMTFRTYIQMTQSFNKKNEDKEKKSVLSNAFYTVRLSYERRFLETMDANHERDIFNYGYVGKFTSYNRPTYTRVAKGFGEAADAYITPQGDTLYLSNYIRQTGYTDTLLTFEQSGRNRVRGNYTGTVYDYYASRNQKISSISQLRGLGGIANGDGPIGVYSNMWASPGAAQTSYSKNMNEALTLFVMSEASVAPRSNPKAKHDLQFGFTYEQQWRRGYSIGAGGLWTLMRQLTNLQFTGMDSSKPIMSFDANGVFQDTVRFQDKITESEQKGFDRNLRAKLQAIGAVDSYGNPITNQTRLNTDAYDPSIYSIDMFNAEELLNNGNSVVSYYGYDYKGNRVSGKPSIDKFLNDPANRTIGAYQPVYMAAWAQDRFVFKDLIVRIGVRMERFDANQLVLKDPYSLAPVYTAGDVRRGGLKVNPSAIPGSIGDDYIVYVNDHEQTGSRLDVTGFRKANSWYDKNGNPVTDPNALWREAARLENTKLNQNIPYLVTAGQRIPDQTSFKDYSPDYKFLPRIWFSFPISTTSQFFGTYDVLAQRPSDINIIPNIAQIDDYYYLSNRLTGTIANPDLKMSQVTDYEIGFRQQIGQDASLGIIASYREFRNQIQLYRYIQAWPFEYNTFGNIDFSTVKSIRLEYELRELGNINLSAHYTLQFADGTGSNAQSSAALIQVGLPSQRTIFPIDFDTRHRVVATFDYRYKEGKLYNGPVVGGKNIFENAGLNIIFTTTSGRPYTQTMTPLPEVFSGVAQRSQVKGTINGAYLPAQFNTDLTLDKNFMIRSEGLTKVTNYRVRVFLMVQNLFNTANVLSVYRYTGSAYDDGYITSAQAEATLRSATNAQSLADLYNVRMVSPGSFALPRLTRLGVAVYF